MSAAEWSRGKPGWEWLFPHIDAGADGLLDAAEHDAFQRYRAEHPDRRERLAGKR